MVQSLAGFVGSAQEAERWRGLSRGEGYCVNTCVGQSQATLDRLVLSRRHAVGAPMRCAGMDVECSRLELQAQTCMQEDLASIERVSETKTGGGRPSFALVRD
jgi:hypothetical protein